MILEQLIFTVISFAIFVYMFFRMIKNNDTTYVIILVLEAIGIALNFLEVLFDVKLNIILVILKYILSIMVPIIIVLLERNKEDQVIADKGHLSMTQWLLIFLGIGILLIIIFFIIMNLM